MTRPEAEDHVRAIKEILGNTITESGHIFYNNYQTLKRGKYYLLGLNPGGVEYETNSEATIDNSFNKFLAEGYWEYAEEWASGHPIFKNLTCIAEELGIELRQVFTSNLVFKRSRNEASMDRTIYDKCLQVHDLVIDIIKPEVIISFGRDTKVHLIKHLQNKGFKFSGSEYIASGHGNWKIIVDKCDLDGRSLRIVNFPHFSRYRICGRDNVIQEVIKKLQ